jgi:Arc/MetJ-type ribon-helix-helix transcriptional regulator
LFVGKTIAKVIQKECIRIASDRINTRLSKPLAEHVARLVGPKDFYETLSEYIRALIRRDMEESDI